MHNFEKMIIDKVVDKYSNKFVQKLGYRKANWNIFTQVLVYIMIVLNMIACYARPDFLTQVVCVLSMLYLSDNENLNRN